MKLVIVESPGKINTIKRYLPDDFAVIASVGHIMQIPTKGLNINIEDGSFMPNIEVMPGKEDVVKNIRDMSSVAEEVFICSDLDREGEKIALDISNLISDKSKLRRSVFNEITKKAVTKAISNPRPLDINMVNSQIARQVLDRLIGYIVSPMVWDKVPGGKSAGRVQSVALRIVADRELEIEAFKIEKFWDIPVKFKIEDKEVLGIVQTKDKNRFLDKESADNAKKAIGSKATVKTVDTKRGKRNPPSPFDTADLQSSASAMFGWASEKTMEVAQSLYEKGACTYHRTDSYVVSEDAAKVCSDWIKEKYGEQYVPKKATVHKEKGITQDAHECIRPTSLYSDDWTANEMNEDDKKLLKLIKARFIASQMENMEVEKTNIIAESGEYNILVEGQSVIFDGWSKVWKSDSKEVFLPVIKEGNELDIIEVQVKIHETRPPDRYNDGTLVKKMKKEGIGRPSTWATAVKSLCDRGYVTIEGKNFVLSDLGRNVYFFLMKEFESFFMDIKFTSKVEEELDKIEKGKSKKLDVIKSFYESLDNIVHKERNQIFADIFG